VLDALRGLGVGPAGVEAWIGRWITAGFDALEPQVARFGAGFAFGQAPGMADCFLVPQTYAARRFAVDLAPYPHIARAVARAEALPAFQAAHPARQPDADPA
jgi:maleylpyruvate isomerase